MRCIVVKQIMDQILSITLKTPIFKIYKSIYKSTN